MRTENHREIRATANHPFLTLTHAGKQVTLSWKRLDELTEQDRVAISGTLPDHGKPWKLQRVPKRGAKSVKLPETSSDELMWLLGFYIGDGYTERARVYFAVPQSDKSHARVVRLLAELFGVDPEVRGNVVR